MSMLPVDCFVSVVSPLSDDADLVVDYVREVTDVLRRSFVNYELVLVDDGSADDTVARVSALLSEIECIRLIPLSRRFGLETAVAAGLETAIGDFVVVALPDSDPPALIPAMVERSRDGHVTVVGVKRTRAGEGPVTRLLARLFYWYCNSRLGLAIPENSTYFRVFSRQAVNAITQIRDRARFLRVFSAEVGYASVPFVYDVTPRRSQPRRRSFGSAVGLAVSIVVANSTHPLRVASWLGFVFSAANALYMVYVLAVYFVKERVQEGWVTLSLQNAGMFFCLFLFLAALSEYIGRILGELRTRPQYFTLEERNSSVVIANAGRKNVTTKADMELRV